MGHCGLQITKERQIFFSISIYAYGDNRYFVYFAVGHNYKQRIQGIEDFQVV
jgi:hypothetical protein